jgi:hypothetical protein
MKRFKSCKIYFCCTLSFLKGSIDLRKLKVVGLFYIGIFMLMFISSKILFVINWCSTFTYFFNDVIPSLLKYDTKPFLHLICWSKIVGPIKSCYNKWHNTSFVHFPNPHFCHHWHKINPKLENLCNEVDSILCFVHAISKGLGLQRILIF